MFSYDIFKLFHCFNLNDNKIILMMIKKIVTNFNLRIDLLLYINIHHHQFDISPLSAN